LQSKTLVVFGGILCLIWLSEGKDVSTFANALAFVALGILVYGIGLVILVRSLPGNLWKQALDEKSIPASIVLAGIALGLGWIVAAAVH